MVLGAIAAIGVGLAGVGIFKGSTDVGKSARNAGRAAEDTLQNISKEVAQMRVFVTETAWPEVNKTLIHVHSVLDRADMFLVASTHTVKVIALFGALCAAYMTHKLISGRFHVPHYAWQQRKSPPKSVATAVEGFVLQIVYYLCLTMAFVLVLQLVKDLFNIAWPHSYPLVILIPSLTTLAILYQHLLVTVKIIFTLLRFIPYLVIGLPIHLGLDPVTKGSNYMNTTPPLQLGLCVLYLILYSSVPYGAYLLLSYLSQAQESTLKLLLIAYGVFYAAAMVINLLGGLIIAQLIRPIWAFLAKRKLQ